MNTELMKAVDSVIGRVRLALLAMPCSSVERSDLDTLAQALRDLEAENARLRESYQRACALSAGQRERAEKADALLLECLTPRFNEISLSSCMTARITAHLGADHA